MASNYKNHLLHEFHRTIEIEKRKARESSEREARWNRAVDRRKNCERILTQLKSAEIDAETSFREAHRSHSEIRSERGEIEEELFSFGEDMEDWPHQ